MPDGRLAGTRRRSSRVPGEGTPGAGVSGPYPWRVWVAEGETTQTQEQPPPDASRTNGAEASRTGTGMTASGRVARPAKWAETDPAIVSVRTRPASIARRMVRRTRLRPRAMRWRMGSV